MPKGYWIVHVTVENAEAYKEYIEKDTSIIEGDGGRFIVRGGQSETLEGETQMRHVVIEFPSYDAAMLAYNNPAYREVAKIRWDNAVSTLVIVEGT